jgi:hypothetical protein
MAYSTPFSSVARVQGLWLIPPSTFLQLWFGTYGLAYCTLIVLQLIKVRDSWFIPAPTVLQPGFRTYSSPYSSTARVRGL